MSKLRGKFAAVQDALSEEDGAQFEKALHDYRIPAEKLAWALKRLGHPISPSLIRTWRREQKFNE